MANNPEIEQFIHENKTLFWWIKPEDKMNINVDALVEAVIGSSSHNGELPASQRCSELAQQLIAGTKKPLVDLIDENYDLTASFTHLFANPGDPLE